MDSILDSILSSGLKHQHHLINGSTSLKLIILFSDKIIKPLGLVRTAGLMIYRFRSQELHQDTLCEKFITEVTQLLSEGRVMASLEAKVNIASLGREVSFLYSQLLTLMSRDM